MKTFLDIVTEREDRSLKIDEIFCPFCKSTNILINDSLKTLLGGREEDDVNHVWTTCKCEECGEKFAHEHYENNTWYTQDREVILGIPNCFEDYIYHCKFCGGNVKRYYVDKITNKPAKSITIDSGGSKSYDVIFRCDQCKAETVSEIEYWRYKWYTKPTKRKKRKKSLCVEFDMMVYEKIGIVEFNKKAICKVSMPDTKEIN